jgi:RNA polymerase sigma-70 factor (ECF subfamily)
MSDDMAAPAMAALGDGDLIARYLAGEERAAVELVERHAGALARFLAVQGAPREELDDLVQEALVKAFRSLGTFRGGANFRTWLMAIGANHLKDRVRQWRRRRVVSLSPDVADPAAQVEGEVEAGLLADRLRDGLGRLARLQRAVFLLRAQQGAGYEEIATVLGISAGAARVHYHHAVKRLRTWMSD